MLISTLEYTGCDPGETVQIQLLLKGFVLGLGKVLGHDELYKIIHHEHLETVPIW